MSIVEIKYFDSEIKFSEIDKGFGELTPSQASRFLEFSGLEGERSQRGYRVTIHALDQCELIRFYKDTNGKWAWEPIRATDAVPSGSYVGSIPSDFSATIDPSDESRWQTDVISTNDGKEFRLCGDGFGSLFDVGLDGRKPPVTWKLRHLLEYPRTLKESLDEIHDKLDAEEREHLC